MGSMLRFNTSTIANHHRSLTYSRPTNFPSVASGSSIAHSILIAIMSAVPWLLRDASFATLLILRSIPNLLLRLRFWNRKRLLSMLLIDESPITSRDLTLPSFNSRRVFDNWRRVGWRPHLQTIAMGHHNTPIRLILNGLGNAWISRLPHNAKWTAPRLVEFA